jgi:WD40 repeat protein
LESGDVSGSLLWFAQALQMENQNQLTEELDRARLSAALRQLSKPAQLFRHENLGYAEASRDGRYVLTVGGGKARVWDAKTGQPVMPELGDEDSPVNNSIFSPDSRRVVMVRGKPRAVSGSAEVWDVETKQLVKILLHNGAVTCATFSDDGARLVTGSEAEQGQKGEARVWGGATFESLQRLSHDHGVVSWVAFSYDGKRLVTGTQEPKGDAGSVWVWHVSPKRPSLAMLPLSAVCFGALSLCQGPMFVAVALSGERSEQPIMRGSHRGGVSYAAFCPPDGRLLVSVSGDASSDTGEAKVWNVETGQQVMTPELKSGILHAELGR